jgi:hypothetical protein
MHPTPLLLEINIYEQELAKRKAAQLTVTTSERKLFLLLCAQCDTEQRNTPKNAHKRKRCSCNRYFDMSWLLTVLVCVAPNVTNALAAAPRPNRRPDDSSSLSTTSTSTSTTEVVYTLAVDVEGSEDKLVLAVHHGEEPATATEHFAHQHGLPGSTSQLILDSLCATEKDGGAGLSCNVTQLLLGTSFLEDRPFAIAVELPANRTEALFVRYIYVFVTLQTFTPTTNGTFLLFHFSTGPYNL